MNRWTGVCALALLGVVTVASRPSSMAHAAGTGYVSLASSARILDTRVDGATVDGRLEKIGIRPYGSTLMLPVAGRADVPADATSVVLNVTVTEPLGDGFVTVFPCEAGRPSASNLNYTPGATVANMAIAKIGPSGSVCLFNGGATHLVVDVAGYFPGVDSLTPLDAPARLLDTRSDGVTADGLARAGGVAPAGSVEALQIGGRASVPAGADSVVLNVTVDQPATAGFVTVYPCDAARPTASNLNFRAGQTVSNAVVTRISAQGTLCVFTSATTHHIVDVAGYFIDAAVFVPLAAPARLLDTRDDGITIDGQARATGLRPRGGTVHLHVTGRAGIPAGASAVVLNVTVDQPAEPGFVTVHPPGAARPNASNLNYGTGQTVPNAVVARLDAGGSTCLFNSGATHLIVDVAGYMTGAIPAGPAQACTATDTPSTTPPNSDWPGYLNGPTHGSAALGDGIAPADAASLRALWTFTAGPATQPGAPGPKFDASPTVVGSRVYIGSRTGIFSALDATTGQVVWEKQLDFGSATLCPAKGIIATASVAPDPVNGAMTVYAPGAQYLYALDAATGAQKWKVSIGPPTADGSARWYNYSSPTVVGGRIYVGLSSNCDDIKIRGGVVQIDQSTGQLLGTYYAVPADHPGVSVWTSVAGDGESVWVTTGNPHPSATEVHDTFSIVRLSAATMVKQEKWTAPIPISEDFDMGSSPTLFRGTVDGLLTDLVGACDKNGVYYAWRRHALAAGPVWQRQVGTPNAPNGACITSAAYDASASTLYVAGDSTTVRGVAVPGALRALDPSTGAIIWEQPLACLPTGSPTVNVSTRLVAVPLYGCAGANTNGVSLFDGATGAPLRTINTVGKVFAQPVQSHGKLFVADGSGRLTAYGL